jgi:hypothetical protein
MFSVTLSVAVPFREPRPRFLRGMLPFGVRTFLWPASRLTSDHLPSLGRYHDQERRKAGTGEPGESITAFLKVRA